MTKYARDEFDRVPETSARQPVHRAGAEIRHRRRLGPVLAAGAAALAVGVLAFLALPHPGFSSAGETPAAPGSSSVAPPAPTATGGSSASQAASGTPSAPAPTSSAPSEDAPVDKTQPVAVFNGSGTAGLASRVGAAVSTDGWTLGTLGNWGGVPQQASVIFYSGAAQKGNAEALGQLLGIPSVVDSAEFEVPLVVVLAPGFE